MFLLTIIIDYVLADIRTAIFSLLIGFIVYKLSKLYLATLSLPPGPLPLPLIGNILMLRSKYHWNEVFKKCARTYGTVFTFWIGSQPYVFVADIDIAKEVFRNNDFSGRPSSYFVSFFSNSKHQDVAFTDFGHTWEALRRVTHSAVLKYSRSDNLVYLASDCVEQSVKLMLDEQGLNKEFNPINYIYLLFLNISATIAFGTSYSIDDPEFLQMRYTFIDIRREIGTKFILWEFSPIFRLLDWKMVKKHQGVIKDFIDLLNNKFKSHYKDYNPSIERDFCDALITAKNDALREGKESAPYLTDENLAMSVLDLFVAGFDTSQQTTQWMLLLMTFYPNIQQKLRQEIQTEIGDRIPTLEDKNHCHYVMAFISETIRVRNVTPNGLTHTAVVNSKIGDYTIPKGNGIFLHLGNILTDEKYWQKGEDFRPERFLEDGKLMTPPPKAYVPFGVGRRICLGEKLGIADLFLTLVRFLQLTSDYDIVLGTNVGIDADPNVTDSFVPSDYNIIFKNKIIVD